jgi:hypothetical protein
VQPRSHETENPFRLDRKGFGNPSKVDGYLIPPPVTCVNRLVRDQLVDVVEVEYKCRMGVSFLLPDEGPMLQP